jgi:hypothetical protein
MKPPEIQRKDSKMSTRENTTAADENAMDAAQVVFSLNPAYFAPQAQDFLTAQERIVQEVERFTQAWFGRRQDAMRAMIEARSRAALQGPADPASAMKEISEWQTRLMQHLAEDAKGYSEMMTKCAGALVQGDVKTKGKKAGKTEKAAKPGKS